MAFPQHNPLKEKKNLVILEPTRVPGHEGDKANTLDLFLTASPNIYFPTTVSFPLGKAHHFLTSLRHGFLPHLDRPFGPQKVFHYSKADWDSLCTSTLLILIFRLSNCPSSSASFVTNARLLGMDLLFPLLTSLEKKFPKWFNSQCTNAVNKKCHYFKEWKRLPTQHSRTSFIQSRNTCSKTIKNAKSSFVQRINNKIASCQAGSRSFWSMAKVVSQNFCQSPFPPLQAFLTLLVTAQFPRPIFLHQSLLPTPTRTTKGFNHIISLLQNSPSRPLSSSHGSPPSPSPARHLQI